MFSICLARRRLCAACPSAAAFRSGLIGLSPDATRKTLTVSQSASPDASAGWSGPSGSARPVSASTYLRACRGDGRGDEVAVVEVEEEVVVVVSAAQPVTCSSRSRPSIRSHRRRSLSSVDFSATRSAQ